MAEIYIIIDVETDGPIPGPHSMLRNSTKRAISQRWLDPIRHMYVALDGAIEHGALFCNMLAKNTGTS